MAEKKIKAFHEMDNDESHALLDTLPAMVACDGGCGAWLDPFTVRPVAKEQVGHRDRGEFRPIHLCSSCRSTKMSKVETKSTR
jgi:hypothetical protein